MLKRTVIALSIALVAGCSTNDRSYDSIADSVRYTYDQDLKQSVVKGPIQESKYRSNVSFDKFQYDLNIKNSETYLTLDMAYRDDGSRQFIHVTDTTGRVYNFVRHEKRIVDCGVSGSSKAGKCDFVESFSFKIPDNGQSQFVIVGREGRNASFNVNKEYLAAMSNVVYRLKTPRADADELRIKKDTLLTAKPVIVAQESVTPPTPPAPKEEPKPTPVVVPAPVVIAPAPVVVPAPIVTAEPVYVPIVKTVPVTKPIVTSVNSNKSTPAVTSYVDRIDETVCKCSSSPQSSSTITIQKVVKVPATVKNTTVVKQQPVKKAYTKPAPKVVLTPIGDRAFCAGVTFKTCETVSNCREAYDQLACGNKKLDPKKKGMPCPNVCSL